MKRLIPLLLGLLLIAAVGCAPAGASGKKALIARSLSRLPPIYDVSFRLEAFEGERKTSYSHITAIRSDDGFYYAASTGERYLFLRQEDETYAFYIWDPQTGQMTSNQDLLLSGSAMERFQDSLLHLEVLLPELAGMSNNGVALASGRLCQIYRESQTAGSQFLRQQTCCVDRETGLLLYRRLQYTDGDSRTFTYLLTCENLETGQVTLPLLPIGL